MSVGGGGRTDGRTVALATRRRMPGSQARSSRGASGNGLNSIGKIVDRDGQGFGDGRGRRDDAFDLTQVLALDRLDQIRDVRYQLAHLRDNLSCRRDHWGSPATTSGAWEPISDRNCSAEPAASRCSSGLTASETQRVTSSSVTAIVQFSSTTATRAYPCDFGKDEGERTVCWLDLLCGALPRSSTCLRWGY